MLKSSPTVEISLKALVRNYRTLLALSGSAPLIPTVKADAYGHGALAASRLFLALGANQLAVTSAKEALALAPLLKKPLFCNEHFTYSLNLPRLPCPSVLILGPVEKEALPSLFSLSAVFSVHSERYAKMLSDAVEREKGRLLPEGYRLPIAIKAETGLNRLGLSLPAALRVCRRDTLYPHTLYTHLGEGGTACGRTLIQLRTFAAFKRALLCEGFSPITHISASAALLRFGTFGEDAARAGLALYGIAPDGCEAPLFPAMRLYATVLSVGRVKRGEGIGYGSFRAERTSRIAVLGVGYADGIPPTASGARVTLRGAPSRIVGEICMDRTLVDIGGAPLHEGDTVCLFGNSENPTATVARAFGVSPYQLLSLRSGRTERVFVSS